MNNIFSLLSTQITLNQFMFFLIFSMIVFLILFEVWVKAQKEK